MSEVMKVIVRQSTIDRTLLNLEKHPEISLTIDWENAVRKTGTKTTLSVICNHCNQKSERGASDLVSNRYRCDGCLVKKYTLCALNAGVGYITHTSSEVIIQCLKCSTHMPCNASALRLGHKTRCAKCFDEKYKAAAEKAGFIYEGKNTRVSQTSVNLQCPMDGTTFVVDCGALLKNKVACLECRISKYRRILLDKNCTFLKILSESGKDSRIEYMNQKGEILDVFACSITQNSFTTSSETHWHSEHSTYLILNKFEDKVYCKIGTARVPVKRLQDLKLLGATSVSTLATFEDRFGADTLESSLHKEFKDYKLNTDVAKQFSGKLLRRKRQDKLERAVVHDGVGEWFTHEVYEVLKTRYNLEKEELWHSV